MTMTIPTLTSLTAGQVAQVSDLQAMTSACTFLMNKPIARVHMTTAGQSLPTTPAAVTYNTADFDTDGMWGGSGSANLYARTPGYYKVRYGVNQNGATGNGWILLTTGANNPAGSGVTTEYCGSYVYGWTASTMACASGLIPVYMYVGDYVSAYFAGNVATSVIVTPIGPYLSMEYVSV